MSPEGPSPDGPGMFERDKLDLNGCRAMELSRDETTVASPARQERSPPDITKLQLPYANTNFANRYTSFFGSSNESNFTETLAEFPLPFTLSTHPFPKVG